MKTPEIFIREVVTNSIAGGFILYILYAALTL